MPWGFSLTDPKTSYQATNDTVCKENNSLGRWHRRKAVSNLIRGIMQKGPQNIINPATLSAQPSTASCPQDWRLSRSITLITWRDGTLGGMLITVPQGASPGERVPSSPPPVSRSSARPPAVGPRVATPSWAQGPGSQGAVSEHDVEFFRAWCKENYPIPIEIAIPSGESHVWTVDTTLLFFDKVFTPALRLKRLVLGSIRWRLGVSLLGARGAMRPRKYLNSFQLIIAIIIIRGPPLSCSDFRPLIKYIKKHSWL